VRRRRQQLPSPNWAGPRRNEREGKKKRGEQAGWKLGQQAGKEEGREKRRFYFSFSKLIFQIHFQKVFESF
jgi:flagellar biosynthesis/type III secretory pathway protein FliH